MTEAEWLSSTDLPWIVDHLCDNLRMTERESGRRKLRLLACSYARRIGALLTEASGRETVTVAELFAEGQASAEQMESSRHACLGSLKWATTLFGLAAANAADPDVREAVNGVSNRACDEAAGFGSGYVIRVKAERVAHIRLLRDVFGNPFRPSPTIDRRWLDME